MKPSSMQKYVAEFIGTMVLVVFGCGTAAAVKCNGASIDAAYVLTALAFGLSIVAMAYSIGNVSGCHVNPAVSLGVSPRGATMLLHSAKAWAWLAGGSFLTPDEVKAVARPALRHRILLRPEAALEGASVDGVLERVLASVPVPR